MNIYNQPNGHDVAVVNINTALVSGNNAQPMTFLNNMREQIEFYFSNSNFQRDTYLQQIVSTHHGSIPVHVIAQFPKIKNLYFGMMHVINNTDPVFAAPIEVMVCRSLSPSQLVTVSDDGYYLRPNWAVLQGQTTVTATTSHGVLPRHPDPVDNAEQAHPLKASLYHHTDATTTTVSPTSFASGSDGSVGGQATTAAEVMNTIIPQHPQSQTVPLVFNPSGGVYYFPTQPSFQHQGFNPQYYPAMAMNTTDMYQSNQTPGLYFHPKHMQNGAYSMHQQYLHPPPPNMDYYPHTMSAPTNPPFNQSFASEHYSQFAANDVHHQHSTAQHTNPAVLLKSSQTEDPETTSPSADSRDNLNAPPAVIRLHETSFHSSDSNDTINHHKTTNLSKQEYSKKGKGKYGRRPSFQRQQSSGSWKGQEASQAQGAPISQNNQESLQGGTESNTGSGPKTNTTNGVIEEPDDVTRKSVPKKDKNRISAAQHQNRTSSSSRTQHNQNRSNKASTSLGHNRGTSQHQQNQTKGGSKGPKIRSSDNNEVAKVMNGTSILGDEHFPSLTKTNTSLPNGVVVKSTDKTISIAEDNTKKKYAEALLQSPTIPKATLSDANVKAVVTNEKGTSDSDNSQDAINNNAKSIMSEVPLVANLMNKFNLNE